MLCYPKQSPVLNNVNDQWLIMSSPIVMFSFFMSWLWSQYVFTTCFTWSLFSNFHFFQGCDIIQTTSWDSYNQVLKISHVWLMWHLPGFMVSSWKCCAVVLCVNVHLVWHWRRPVKRSILSCTFCVHLSYTQNLFQLKLWIMQSCYKCSSQTWLIEINAVYLIKNGLFMASYCI